MVRTSGAGFREIVVSPLIIHCAFFFDSQRRFKLTGSRAELDDKAASVLGQFAHPREVYESTGQVVFTEAAQPAEPNELYAWKDTVKSFPGTITRVISKFDLPAGTDVVAGKNYRYVWHCHILEHEDNEMMRPNDVSG